MRSRHPGERHRSRSPARRVRADWRSEGRGGLPCRGDYARSHGERSDRSLVNREYHRWYSPTLGRDMELLLYGHAGAPVLVFPTSMGRFYEYEDRGMVSTLRQKIEEGWITLLCVDSVDAESWYNRDVHPEVRVARHLQYEGYL